MAATLEPALPRHLQIEVTGACNLRCRMCLVRYAPSVSRAEGALSYEQFLALVDRNPHLEKLTLQGLGEPLLSPHLMDMVTYARERSIEVGFNSNGVLLTRPRARQLVAAGLSWLHVSLDGATAATYEDVRHGPGLKPRPGQFDRVVANLRGLVEERSAAATASPRIQLVFVAMRRNVHELEALVELAAGIGVDEVWVQNLSHSFSDTDPAGGYAGIREYAEQEALPGCDDPGVSRRFERARETGRRLGVKVRLPRLEPPASGSRGCDWPWDGAYVTHRGEVQPCCMVMGSDRATLGRLDDAPFETIWHSPPYREFRRRLAGGDDPPEVCRGCSMYRGTF